MLCISATFVKFVVANSFAFFRFQIHKSDKLEAKLLSRPCCKPVVNSALHCKKIVPLPFLALSRDVTTKLFLDRN